LKRDGVIAKPTINKHVLRPFDKYLVIASDGIWDVLEDQEAVNFCRDEQSTKDIAQAIVKAAMDKGSKDNASCLVIKFNSSSIF
jgi:serine/threonine protein phosphatase PrpC